MSNLAEQKVTEVRDKYILDPRDVMDAPTTFSGSLKFLGPGMVLTASIVGSGELIATTTLGAQAGFVTLWVILVSCFVKVCVQLEWGKHIINTGETSMTAINKLPGWKIRKVHWLIWAWFILMTLKFLQVGGIVGGVAQSLNIAFPFLSIPVWAWITAISCSLLVFRGNYGILEKVCLALIIMFTIFTFVSLFSLQATKYAITWGQIASGFTFSLPPAAVTAAIAAFGITGVGGDEIMHYGYWLIEKGYARYTGPKDDTPQWAARAKSWIRVMYIDAFMSMIVYTVMTAAFYVMGAAVLYGMSKIPGGNDMIKTLANMYTQSLGPGVMWMYLIGAFAVLYSTALSATGAWSRQYADAFSQFGLLKFTDTAQRNKWVGILAWIIPIMWCILFLFFKAPVLMVQLGGIGTSILLLMVVYAAIYFKFKRLDKRLYPSKAYNIFFWVSCAAIGILAIRGLLAVFGLA